MHMYWPPCCLVSCRVYGRIGDFSIHVHFLGDPSTHLFLAIVQVYSETCQIYDDLQTVFNSFDIKASPFGALVMFLIIFVIVHDDK